MFNEEKFVKWIVEGLETDAVDTDDLGLIQSGLESMICLLKEHGVTTPKNVMRIHHAIQEGIDKHYEGPETGFELADEDYDPKTGVSTDTDFNVR